MFLETEAAMGTDMERNSDKPLRLVVVIAVLAVPLCAFSVWGYFGVLKDALLSETAIVGWWVFWRLFILMLLALLSGVAAIWYIARGATLAAHNASAVLLAVLILVYLPRAVGGQSGSWFQTAYAAAWVVCLGLLMWRVMPNTSLCRRKGWLLRFGRGGARH